MINDEERARIAREAMEREMEQQAKQAMRAEPGIAAQVLLERLRSTASPDAQVRLVLDSMEALAALEPRELTIVELDLFKCAALREIRGRYKESLARERKRQREGTDDDSRPRNDQHAQLVQEISAFLSRNHIAMNAAGFWANAESWAPIPGNVKTLAQDFAITYRRNAEASTERITETMETLGRQRAEDRRRVLVQKLTGHPATDAGRFALIDWVRAVTGGESPLDLAAMLHWLWLVKRSLAGLPREHDIMPVVYGIAQGSGKTTAVARLVRPLMELATPVKSETLTDPRNAEELGRFLAGVWDEMDGATRAEVASLKSTLTSTTVTHRILGTHSTGVVRRTMNFIGTSNKPISAIIRDAGGARRFYQLDAQDRVDWDAINAIDYDSLWRAVSELDAAPIGPALIEMREVQHDLRHQDSVRLWLEAETWGPFTFAMAGMEPDRIGAYPVGVGESLTRVRQRYVLWCRVAGEQPVPMPAFSQRLTEEGCHQHRPRAGGPTRPYLWLRPRDTPADRPRGSPQARAMREQRERGADTGAA